MTAIHVHGGLCNRLRAILSWRAVCGPITVAWKPDSQVCDARFGTAFKPLDGVTFVDAPEPGMVSTYEPHPDAKPGWEEAYRDLQPIMTPPRMPAVYSAVHMRRTDCVAYQRDCGAYEPDDVFIDWARKAQGLIFVATDNGTTQRVMINALPGRVVTHYAITEHADQDRADVRNTTLIHAAWDLFTCAGATMFRGSGASSFTHAIHVLRGLR